MGQRQIFLQALASGASAAQACAHSRLASSTLYLWRRQDAKFRRAWDEAALTGAAAVAARRDDEIFRRALEPVARPVIHRGEVVGVRQRYSDASLMFAMRDMRLRQQAAAENAAPAPGVKVIIAPVKDNATEDTATETADTEAA
jgi:transposase-like protein